MDLHVTTANSIYRIEVTHDVAVVCGFVTSEPTFTISRIAGGAPLGTADYLADGARVGAKLVEGLVEGHPMRITFDDGEVLRTSAIASILHTEGAPA